MLKRDGQLVYSPSDLIRYLKSPFASWMDRYHLEFPGELTPDEDSEELKLVARAGDLHELKFLESRRSHGSVCEIERGDAAIAETLAAIGRREPVIYQPCLELAPFRGYADFLILRRDDQGAQPVYEVWDTKLARETKPYYLIQLCCYAEMLEPVLGRLPEHIVVVLGSGKEPRYRTADFLNYYRQIKAGFLALMQDFDPKQPPEPLPRADHGRWTSHAQRWIEENDHLVQVAGINVSQIRKLNAAGIRTVAQLARHRGRRIRKLSDEMLERLVEQAVLQVKTRDSRARAATDAMVPPAYRVLPASPDNPRHGLALLPPENEGDVYFDMEGYPLVEGGLEYLFGATTQSASGKLTFHDWWAHDAATEKAAFEGFIDWVYARWQRHPGMHIFHYANYEVAAVRRLAGKHGTREAEADELQRNGVFVDLYRVVRQGLRVGEPNYSIKSIELLYRPKRSGDVASAGQSIVYYANWMESGESPDWRQSPLLRKIRDYNQDDCESTAQLCAWLRDRQGEAGILFLPPPPKPEEDETAPPTDKQLELEARMKERKRVMDALCDRAKRHKDPEAARLDRLFMELLDFHQREERPIWWRLFRRMGEEVEELKEDLECIGGAEYVPGSAQIVKRSQVFTYRFDPEQETKIRVGDRVYARPSTAATFSVEALTEDGEIQVKISTAKLDAAFPRGMPKLTSFLPREHVSAGTMKDALLEMAAAWADKEVAPLALLRFLRRQAPLLPKGLELIRPRETAADAAVRCVQSMEASTLCLQGPPGTGKTTTAARMIAVLLAQGKSIGVMSNSHKAIDNLLRAVCELPEFKAPILSVGGDGDLEKHFPKVEVIPGTSAAGAAFEKGLIGGTAWLFARPEWVDRLDYLFVDEAGQVSLANLVAVSRCADNLVLMGDQMQLEQPIQGNHPGESGQSALLYYLQHHQTIPRHLGLFLEVTHRLEPQVCAFVSDLIYEGRLEPAAGNENRRLCAKGTAGGFFAPESGLHFLPVIHDGNIQASDEEADVVRLLMRDLIGRTRLDENGKPAGKIALKDVLVVAPYNLQVRRLKEMLPPDARVGSVDKFQGQEAEAVIVSMCSSFGEYGSRGLEFLLDQNRLNVALTRARTLAVVVGDERIAGSQASTIPAMERLNLFCRLVQNHTMRDSAPASGKS